MVKWVDIDNWKVKVELIPAQRMKWNWSFQAVDGPKGESVVASDSLDAAFREAMGAAILALAAKSGPESASTDFDNI